jgi:MoxR-vWA-beta-propeller ternary system domain bpX5
VSGDLPVVWVPRAAPLEVAAAVVVGPRSSAWIERVRGGPWAGVVGDGWSAALGAEFDRSAGSHPAELPWVDGIVYLGRDPEAPRLLLPTHSTPTVAELPVVSLLDRWVFRSCGGHPGPFAVVPGFGVVPLGGARPLRSGT